MKLTFVKLREELKPYIQNIWVCESPVGMPLSANSIAAPNGCPKIIINYENYIISEVNGQIQESKEHGLYFAGNRDIPVQLSTPIGKTGFIGVEFYPHGAYPIFGIPMFETANCLLPIDMLLEKQGNMIGEMLINSESLNAKINFIQDIFIDNLRKRQIRNVLVEYCVKTLKKSNGLTEIAELEKKTGYSRRYLEILFRNHIGFTPKTLSEIFRFQKFYRIWAHGKTYAELKGELGEYYFDQAHFIKEFKRMTGFSPRQYTKEISNEFGKLLSLH